MRHGAKKSAHTATYRTAAQSVLKLAPLFVLEKCKRALTVRNYGHFEIRLNTIVLHLFPHAYYSHLRCFLYINLKFYDPIKPIMFFCHWKSVCRCQQCEKVSSSSLFLYSLLPSSQPFLYCCQFYLCNAKSQQQQGVLYCNGKTLQ